MDLSNGQIELRPLNNVWEPSSSNWVLHYVDQNSVMRKNSDLLIDIQSPTFVMLHSSLGALDHAEHLVVTWSQTALLLSGDLPRLRLTFKLNKENLLESLNLTDMVVDHNQYTGTMIGLSNQLVLREKSDILGGLPRSRRVIIPFGEIIFQPRYHHINISVNTASQASVKFYEYRVDDELGLLIGDGSLISKLYQAYLHALSSYCLPDPLTERTGTQAALSVLYNAGCSSFRALTSSERTLLNRLAALAPEHVYYPNHLQVMQSINWSNVSTLAQNQAFYWATQSIAAHAERLRVFDTTPCTVEEPLLRSTSDGHLRCRAALRMSVYAPDGTFNMPLQISPAVYGSTRDFTMAEGTKNELNAAIVATNVLEWPLVMDKAPKLLDALVDWNSVGSEQATLAYSREWLTKDLAKTWITTYNICRQSDKRKDQFRLAFSLSAMAFVSEENRSFVPMLLAFATNPSFRYLSPPPWTSYDTKLGFKPTRDEVYRCAIEQGSFDSSNESRLAKRDGESNEAQYNRQHGLYQKRLRNQAAEVADYCIAQWPIEHPTMPRTPQDKWVFNETRALKDIKILFEGRFRNLQLKEYALAVQTFLDGMHRSTKDSNFPRAYHPLPLALQPSRAPSYASVTLDDIFRRVPPVINSRMPTLALEVIQQYRKPNDSRKLETLLSHFTWSMNSFQRQYGISLEKSREGLMKDKSRIFPPCIPCPLSDLIDYQDRCWQSLQSVLGCIHNILLPVTDSQRMVHLAGQWPSISLGSLLRILGNRNAYGISSTWISTLATLAQHMLLYQWSQRLVHMAHLENSEDFFKELESNIYDAKPEASQNVDWLLIQVRILAKINHLNLF